MKPVDIFPEVSEATSSMLILCMLLTACSAMPPLFHCLVVPSALTHTFLQVDHMTKLMLEGNKDESDDKENRKGNRRETWAPGLAGTHAHHMVDCALIQLLLRPFGHSLCCMRCSLCRACLNLLCASFTPWTGLFLHASGVMFCSAELRSLECNSFVHT